MSLKYRIALIIFILEAVMMTVVLKQTLSQSYQTSKEQINSNQAAIINLVSGISQTALITDEYAELQPYIQHLLANTSARHILLTNSENIIVASSQPDEIGTHLQPSIFENPNFHWEKEQLNTAFGFTGQLAIAFSDKELNTTYNKIRDLGIGIALFGMFMIAAVGLLVGYLLTRKLNKITEASHQIPTGNFQARMGVTGNDELGTLASTFDNMVEHFIQVKNELNSTLSAVKLNEKSLIESEERFRQLAENINEVFWLGSPDWNQIYYVSPAYEKDWQQSAEDLYDDARKWLAAVHEDDRSMILADIPDKIDADTQLIDFHEYRVVKPDGQIIWIKARAYPIRDVDGQVIRIAGIAENISERKKSEENLRQVQKMDTVGKLTSGIAHDFNNMLGVILGYTELIEQIDPVASPEITRYAKEIHRAATRGSKLTRKLLSFSHKRIGERYIISLNKQLVDIKQMLEKTLTVRIELKYELSDSLWLINIDDSDFDDAIINICINSMHAITDKGTITISTHNETLNLLDASKYNLPAGDYVLINITDNGAGMDARTMEQIFDPFFTTKGEDGTGLGLSQVYGFMERCNGAINVYSEPGHGTRISLYFPRYRGVPQQDDASEQTTVVKISGNKTVLVVDDEPGLLDFASTILSEQGFNVISAANAEEALEVLNTENVDILFSDIIMPKMNGYELAETVSRKHPDVKIQLTSGFSDISTTAGFSKELKENILSKPYSAQNLIDCIYRL